MFVLYRDTAGTRVNGFQTVHLCSFFGAIKWITNKVLLFVSLLMALSPITIFIPAHLLVLHISLIEEIQFQYFYTQKLTIATNHFLFQMGFFIYQELVFFLIEEQYPIYQNKVSIICISILYYILIFYSIICNIPQMYETIVSKQVPQLPT